MRSPNLWASRGPRQPGGLGPQVSGDLQGVQLKTHEHIGMGLTDNATQDQR